MGKRPKCFDCPDCLPGSEPSIPCGTSVNDRPDIHCVSCKLGETYSDKYDKSQCKACTICSKGKAVKNSCTFTTNAICDNKCGPGFYTVNLISSCLPCAQCCGDGMDELAAECANDKKKCKMRSSLCTYVQTTPPKPFERNSNISSTLPTTQTVSLESDTTTMTVNEQEELVLDEISTSITPSPAMNNKESTTERVVPGKQDWTVVVVILLVIVLAFCVVMFVYVTVKKCFRLRSSGKHGSYRTSDGEASPRPHSSASYQPSQESAPLLLLLSRGSESPQPSGSESSQSSGLESPQPSGSESPQPSGSESSQSSGLESPQPKGYESSQPSGSESPQLSGSESPQPSGSESSEPSGSQSPQLNGRRSPQPNVYESLRANESSSSKTVKGIKSALSNESELLGLDRSALAHSSRSAQEQDKSNPGEWLLMKIRCAC